MRITALLLLGLLAFPLFASAQDDLGCGLQRMMEISGEAYPQPQISYQKQGSEDDRIYLIPVVFHIIHDGGPENLPDSVIFNQIEVLNEDFGRYGGGHNENPLSADAKIRFCLAQTDPNGNLTNGIVRVQSRYTNMVSSNELLTKNLSRWDPFRYLNVWVVRSMDNSTTVAYSYLPTNSMVGSAKDGVVIRFSAVGRNNRYNNSDFGRMGHTLTHEVGHYLNLLHTWGRDAQGYGGCDDDDEIFDTPLCNKSYNASFNIITQTCDKPVQCGVTRQTENYMDYSNDPCKFMFTKGQIERMRMALRNVRSALYSIPNAHFTGCSQYNRNINTALDDSLQIAPNLLRQELIIYPFFKSPQDGYLYMFDMTGRLILQANLPQMTTGQIRLALPDYTASGLHYIIIKTPAATFEQKLILMNSRP